VGVVGGVGGGGERAGAFMGCRGLLPRSAARDLQRLGDPRGAA